MDDGTKQCTRCDRVLVLDQFSKAPKGKLGRKSTCKACDRARARELYTPVDPADAEARRRARWAPSDDPKRCTRCNEVKARDQFSKSRDGKYGPVLRPECKACQAIKAREWYADNPERANDNRRRWNLAQFGLTPAEYDEMLRAQGGTCAICGRAEQDNKRGRLSVDHDHGTGAVRGLLCNRCNRALGLFDDDATVLRRAITYLRRAGR